MGAQIDSQSHRWASPSQQSEQQSSSTISHHSCLWYRIPPLTLWSVRVVLHWRTLLYSPFPSTLPISTQLILKMAKTAADLWDLASTSESAKDLGRILCMWHQCHAETSSLLTNLISNSFSTCFKGKTGKKSRMDKDKKNRLTETFFPKSLSTGRKASLLKNFAHSFASPSPESTHHINIILLQASLLQWINQVSQKYLDVVSEFYLL